MVEHVWVEREDIEGEFNVRFWIRVGEKPAPGQPDDRRSSQVIKDALEADDYEQKLRDETTKAKILELWRKHQAAHEVKDWGEVN